MKTPPTAENDETKLEAPSNEDGGDKSNDFSEYMWMENEEQFDNEVMKQLEEEALMEQCIEAMLEDELAEKPVDTSDFVYDFQKMCLQENCELAKKSTLNPDAAEFIPRVTAKSPPACSSIISH